MTKRVLDVGNCGPDHASITHMIEGNFDAEVVQVHDGDEAVQTLTLQPFDLVLVNRLMDRTGASGLDIIKTMKTDADLRSVPVMMVTNFEDHQDLAIAAGAEPGFGKQAMNLPKTIDLLRPYLD